ncbi:MAG TPA: hypothetical protein VFY93_19335 [Planctomycetota bacterium]|nr:hypothetical protein [Planctomycetota bacterium]
MKVTRILPFLLAGMTLVLVGANALPTVQRKRLLREERRRLEREVSEEERAGLRLAAELEALGSDPFYIERLVVETWNGVPQGATPFGVLEIRDDVVVRAP